MYNRIPLKVDKVRQSKVIAALTILVSSPDLELQELADGVIIDPKSNPPFNIRNRLPNPNWILDIPSCFVTSSGKNDPLKVSLAHFTVQE
jgi:hypothetical protein